MQTVYKKVYEKLRGEREVVDVDNIFGDVHIHATNSMFEITEEEFKKSLGSKTPVNLSVYRETFVIEVDEERGKIIAKKYTVHKNSRHIKKINKTTLKSNKSYVSLTFDLKTREFSIFRASTNAKNIKTTPFIRRNTITQQVLCFVEEFFNFGHVTENEAIEGLNIIAKYLGHTVSVQELSEIYDYNTAIDHSSANFRAKDLAKFFVLFNHLSTTRLNHMTPLNMLEIGFNFKHDRKKYIHKSIHDYYADQIEVDDVDFVRTIVNKKDFFNATTLRAKREGGNEPLVKASYFMGVNFVVLKILYHLGYSKDEILSSKKLEDLVLSKDKDQYYETINFDLTKIISVSDIRENADLLKLLIEKDSFNTTKIIELFILQKRLETIYNLRLGVQRLATNSRLRDDIENLLFQATEKTGVYLASKSFLNKLKKHLPTGSTISIGKKPTDDQKTYGSFGHESFSTALITIKHKKEIYRMYVDRNGIKWYENDDKSNGKISIFDAPKKVKLTELYKGIRSFELSFNKGVKQIPIRATYSKKYFEHLLGDVITRNEYENIIKNLVYLDK